MSRDLDYYRRLPYKLDVDRFEEEEDGRYYFCASYLELPAVKGVHSDRLMAIKLARELFDSYVEAQLAWGEEIPEPPEPRFRRPGGLFRFVVVDAGLRSSSDQDLIYQPAAQLDKTSSVEGKLQAVG